MTENLNEMLGEMQGSPIPPEVDTTQADTVVQTTDTVESEVEATDENVMKVQFIPFSQWVSKYETIISQCSGIKKLNMSNVKGIDPNESIIFKLPQEEEKMKTKQIDDANLIPVLDLPPVRFSIFKNSTFMIVHFVSEQIVIKCYGLKTGPLLFHCKFTEDGLIPFLKEKIKKKNSGYISAVKTYADIDMEANVDSEGIFLLYKQAQKVHDKLKSKKDALVWFTSKMVDVADINHLIKIDSVLINAFK